MKAVQIFSCSVGQLSEVSASSSFFVNKLMDFCVFVFSSASPLLSWRDVQHIIVKTSRAGHLSAPDWKTNAAGYNGKHTLTQT